MTSKSKYSILYVDDDKENLTVFYATFHWNYEVVMASSGKEALMILVERKVDIIITDQQMPEMTGTQFLECVVPNFPDIPRIIITGYADVESIIEAINKGKIFQYITKPWKKDEVQEIVDRAIEETNLKNKNRKLINGLKRSNIQLNNALSELDRFIYKASHDLMAPITTIMGLVNLAKLDVEHQERINYISKIDLTAKKMKYFLSHLTLVNMVYDKTIHKKKTRLFKVLNNYKSYSNASFQIEVEIDKDINCYTDEELLNIAFSQIIENSLKFRHPGRKGVVRIEGKKHDEGVFIAIADNGLGIDENFNEQYFNMFFKGGNSKGSGIGLYLARKVIEKLKGEIWLAGKMDEGTTVNIFLPYDIDFTSNKEMNISTGISNVESSTE